MERRLTSARDIVRLRRATVADNSALVSLCQAPMAGDLVLSTIREPDFFALYEMQQADVECWVADAAGTQVSAVATALVREGWLNGKVEKVGYLGDLRTTPSARKRHAVAQTYGSLLDGIATRTGCELFLTTVLASNRAALQSLVRRRVERSTQPYYHLLRPFSAVSVQFRQRRRWQQGGWEVRHAERQDIPAVAQFLGRDHRSRVGGYRFDNGELEHRLQHWPGFTSNSIYLAYARSGELMGCAGAWDPSAVKQYRVLEYRGSLAWAKCGWNALAKVTGWPALPKAGGVFRYFYLCNVSVAREDPDIFRALLERIYADYQSKGYHFFTLHVDADDPLRPALRTFTTRELPFHLYAVSRAQHPQRVFPRARSGFEIALA